MMEGEEDGERRCSLIDLNFNFSGSSDYPTQLYIIIHCIIFISTFDEKYL